ncbi:co-chaperone HscB [Aliiglaciecola lipolytica]|uniref:Co-chaperone protein HscB homolog n=1 Tax=Aliiglaciecola lipolytica E3 TaxID=1127673 RepID=K6YV41_9ALTE|nr:co-chaperone HscB [Aliiglaciecola lipolytica]GAC15140.1 molecular chaperone HscB [Aliiglaciecola lipolytica E3]
MNFFTLFGLPENFQVDKTQLANVYQSLAKVTHPDRFSNAGGQEKLMAVQKNAQVNDGYQILKNPLSRAEHLLELRGIELQHETQTMQDPTFLMQQMEWREHLSEVDDAADPEQALADLDKDVAIHSKQHFETLSELLEEQTEQANALAAAEVRKLKFLNKLHKEIELKEDSLFED